MKNKNGLTVLIASIAIMVGVVGCGKKEEKTDMKAVTTSTVPVPSTAVSTAVTSIESLTQDNVGNAFENIVLGKFKVHPDDLVPALARLGVIPNEPTMREESRNRYSLLNAISIFGLPVLSILAAETSAKGPGAQPAPYEFIVKGEQGAIKAILLKNGVISSGRDQTGYAEELLDFKTGTNGVPVGLATGTCTIYAVSDQGEPSRAKAPAAQEQQSDRPSLSEETLNRLKRVGAQVDQFKNKSTRCGPAIDSLYRKLNQLAEAHRQANQRGENPNGAVFNEIKDQISNIEISSDYTVGLTECRQ